MLHVNERYLIRLGLVEVTPHGRVPTPNGRRTGHRNARKDTTRRDIDAAHDVIDVATFKLGGNGSEAGLSSGG